MKEAVAIAEAIAARYNSADEENEYMKKDRCRRLDTPCQFNDCLHFFEARTDDANYFSAGDD